MGQSIEDEIELSSRAQIYADSGLAIDDPSKLQGLSTRIERDATPASAIEYNTRNTTGAKVDCAACGHVRNHYRGFVVSFADGRRALVGIECGEKDFFGPGAWEALSNRLAQQKRAVLYSHRSAPAVASIDNLVVLINEFRQNALVIEDFLSKIEEAFPDLWRGLVGAARTSASLMRDVRLPETDDNPSGFPERQPRYSQVVVVTFPCRELLTTSPLSARADFIIKQVQRVRSVLADQDATLPAQAKAFSTLRQLKSEMDDMIDMYERGRGFLAEDFWIKAAQWARADPHRDGNYKCKHGRLRWTSSEYEDESVPIPGAQTAPPAVRKQINDTWPSL